MGEEEVAHFAQLVAVYHQDVCQDQAHDSRGLGEGEARRQGGGADHRSPHLPSAVSAAHGAGPRALSALSERYGGMAHLAPDLWGHP